MSSEASSSVTSMREARRSRTRRAAARSGPALSTFIASWQLALDAAAKSSALSAPIPTPSGRSAGSGGPRTARFCGRRGRLAHPRVPARRGTAHVGRVRAVHFRNIRVFFGWLASEGERENPNPMDVWKRRRSPRKRRRSSPKEELARLLKTCSGATFVDRRDTAIMRVFIDTGLRVSVWLDCGSTQTTSRRTMSS